MFSGCLVPLMPPCRSPSGALLIYQPLPVEVPKLFLEKKIFRSTKVPQQYRIQIMGCIVLLRKINASRYCYCISSGADRGCLIAQPMSHYQCWAQVPRISYLLYEMIGPLNLVSCLC